MISMGMMLKTVHVTLLRVQKRQRLSPQEASPPLNNEVVVTY